MKKTPFIDILGWVGVLLILGAYAALSLGFTDAGYLFQVPTLLGSLAVAIEAWAKKDTQPAMLNIIFALIAIVAITRLSFFH